MKTNTLNIKIVGEVIYGNGLGHSLGYPTANLCAAQMPESVQCGVYASLATTAEGTFAAVVNIGHSPSVVHNGALRIEAHLLGFSGDLYGTMLSLELLYFVRAEQKFPSREALCAQIALDCERTLQLLGGEK